jgi:geranylgeranyl pyrophosphate synthase
VLARAILASETPAAESLFAEVVTGEAFTASPVGPLPWTTQVLTICCAAYEQPVEQVVPVAACLQLLGLVSCVLDAVQDNDPRLRRYLKDRDNDNRSPQDPHALAALVTNSGMAFIGLAWQALLEHGPRYGLTAGKIVEVGQLLAAQWTRICAAQHCDLTLGRSSSIGLDGYMEIVSGKAGAIGGTICEAGAILAGRTGAERDLWYTIGRERTIAQQLSDDCRDLDQDLANGQQISQPVLYGFHVVDSGTLTNLQDLLMQARGASTAAATARQTLINALEEAGAVHYALLCQLLHEAQALSALDQLALPDPWQSQLARWIRSGNPAYHAGVESPF